MDRSLRTPAGSALILRFERGGDVPVTILGGDAPRTVEAVGKLIPFSGMAYHSRWSGREVNAMIHTGERVPLENHTIQTAPGDVIYWREWERDADDVSEAIAVYYGAELTRFHRGEQFVNVFGRVSQEHWDLLREIGERIWRQGGERLEILWNASQEQAP